MYLWIFIVAMGLKSWQSADSEKDTAVCLADALKESFPDIVLKKNLNYSDDMKTGMDTAVLEQWCKPLLGHLIRLDPRGGGFSKIKIC